MKKMVFIFLIVFSLFSFIPSFPRAAQRGLKITSSTGDTLDIYNDYYALVIGVSEYDKWPDLPKAVSDAREVGAALEKLGFRVALLENPTSKELKQGLNSLTYEHGREKNRAILLFFAGHGATEALVDGTKLGYIIPKDCPVMRNDPIGFVNSAISMRDIEAYSLRIQSRHVLVLFDSRRLIKHGIF